MPDVWQVVSPAIRVDKAAIPLLMVQRTASSKSQVRPTPSLFMVDRNSTESPSSYELRMAVLGSSSFGIPGNIRYCWCCRSSGIPIGRSAVRTERYRDKSDKVIREAHSETIHGRLRIRLQDNQRQNPSCGFAASSSSRGPTISTRLCPRANTSRQGNESVGFSSFAPVSPSRLCSESP